MKDLSNEDSFLMMKMWWRPSTGFLRADVLCVWSPESIWWRKHPHIVCSHTLQHTHTYISSETKRQCSSWREASCSDVCFCVCSRIFDCWSTAFTPCSVASRDTLSVCVLHHHMITYCRRVLLDCVCLQGDEHMSVWFHHMADTKTRGERVHTVWSTQSLRLLFI